MEKLKILSATLAEIYLRQGHLDKAKDVYERLLAREMNNSFYQERLMLLTGETQGKRRLRILTSILRTIEEKRDERATL
jgi:pentatricopeptide repeat protein